MAIDTTAIPFRQPDHDAEDPLTAVLRSGARRLLAQAVEAEAAWEHAYGEDWLDARLSWKWYFRRDWKGS